MKVGKNVDGCVASRVRRGSSLVPLSALSLSCSGWDDEDAGCALNVAGWWTVIRACVKIPSTLSAGSKIPFVYPSVVRP